MGRIEKKEKRKKEKKFDVKKRRKKPARKNEEKMDIDRTIRDLQRLESAVKNLIEEVGIAQTFGPEALPEHMSCGEAEVFAELLDALGIPEEASSLRLWHLFLEDDEEKRKNHPDWVR